ncbi:MAG TPA: hypothetical protein VGN93_04400 [Shinella sp.]|uniref:hypothetical protein n=1 Tax=Shinella sp. TaxID=1870904 RepID=UPI002E1057F9|nr:hypothetical protein [Shinella sp.]
MISRSTLYLTDDGRLMTSQEQLALLLDLGGLDSAEAAEIAGVAPSTIATYRKASKGRQVSAVILSRLEAHVLERIGRFAQAAGYELKAIEART